MQVEQVAPQLTEKRLRSLASSQSLERGNSYYRNGSILNPVRQENHLRATCQGGELYSISITLGNDEIVTAHCTCAYDWGGLCKHQVALLLTYIHQPQAFTTIPPMQDLLASHSREELVTLISRMVQKHPSLLTLLELSIPRASGQRIDSTLHRRQAQQIFRRDDYREIIDALGMLVEQADQLMQQGDWLNAGSIYQALLMEAIVAYDETMLSIDYDGHVIAAIQDLVTQLGACLAEAGALDAATHELWLMTLVEAELQDVALGGFELAGDAWEIVLQSVVEKEWQAIATRLRLELEQCHDWSRQHLTNLLASYYQHVGQSDVANAVIHELGTPEQRAHLLVEEGDIDGAIVLATEHLADLPGMVTPFADALVAAGAATQAVEFVAQQYEQHSHWSYPKWMVSYYQAGDRPALALQWQQRVCSTRFSIDAYRTLRELAQQTGSWDEVCRAMVSELNVKNQFRPLLEIALEEQNGDLALKIFSMLSKGEQVAYRDVVAQAIETSHPMKAIQFYEAFVEQYIKQRNRGAYQLAVSYMARIKAIYGAIGSLSSWATYLQTIRTKNSTLRALLDEIKKAAL